jgi:hypothetical protein
MPLEARDGEEEQGDDAISPASAISALSVILASTFRLVSWLQFFSARKTP